MVVPRVIDVGPDLLRTRLAFAELLELEEALEAGQFTIVQTVLWAGVETILFAVRVALFSTEVVEQEVTVGT